MRRSLTLAALTSSAALLGCSDRPLPTDAITPPDAQFGIRTETGDAMSGPPFYSFIQPGWFPMTDEWAAVPWIRDTNCVPRAFNILNLLDLTIVFPPSAPPAPRPLFCDLTVEGHEIWNTNPPDPSVGPLNTTYKGLGAVPIYFVATAQLLPAIADGVLTIADLEAMSSLRVGHASAFTLTNQSGSARGRPGTGKINITATGRLEDGTPFYFGTSEGPPYEDAVAMTRIEFH